jgi:rubrerythrin
MSNYFSDLEGLRLAVDIETNGYKFYRQAHENAQNEEHKLLFSFLMQEELNHAAKFKSMYENLLKTKAADSDDYLYDPEVSRYLQVLVDTHIFPQNASFKSDPAIANGVLATGWQWQTPGQKNPGSLTAEAILRIALQAEKDSILFYDEMMNNARFPDARQIFAELKTEEQTHVAKLQEMIRTLT